MPGTLQLPPAYLTLGLRTEAGWCKHWSSVLSHRRLSLRLPHYLLPQRILLLRYQRRRRLHLHLPPPPLHHLSPVYCPLYLLHKNALTVPVCVHHLLHLHKNLNKKKMISTISQAPLSTRRFHKTTSRTRWRNRSHSH